MSFFASNNRIVIRDLDGSVSFDTDSKMPAIAGSFSGTISLDDNGKKGEETFLIAPVPPGVDFLFPTYSVTITGSLSGSVESTSIEGLPTSAIGGMVMYVDSRKVHEDWGHTTLMIMGTVAAYIASNNLYIVTHRRTNFIEQYGLATTIKYRIYLGKYA